MKTKSNLKAANTTLYAKRADGSVLTPTKRREALALLDAGVAVTDVAEALNLSTNQTEMLSRDYRKTKTAEIVDVSEQIKRNLPSEGTQEGAKQARAYLKSAIDHVGTLAAKEPDLTKASQALKVLWSIAQSGEE